MITEFYMQVYRGYVTMLADNGVNDVTRSKDISTFWTAVTSLNYELERCSKAQNIWSSFGF